jgi:hypothetical protein
VYLLLLSLEDPGNLDKVAVPDLVFGGVQRQVQIGCVIDSDTDDPH